MINKSQITNLRFPIDPNTKDQKKKFCLLLFGFLILFAICGLTFAITPSFAKEITILYTGQTHSMLYTCNCPIENDGGVARRASLIKELRKKNPDTLLIDSGAFFAGGLSDEYTQNTQLDMARTAINFKAMELMGYDAAAVGDDEFNFGKDFLKGAINRSTITLLSCNIVNADQGESINNMSRESRFVSPYVIKEIAGVKIGIIGVTNLKAAVKASGLKFVDPRIAVKQAIAELKKNKADIIVLLSNLKVPDDLNLIREIEDIDILISDQSHNKEDSSSRIGKTIVLRPVWQARRLGKLSLVIKDNKINSYKAEQLRLSDEIRDDPDVYSILPRCFSDANCKQKDFVGICQDSGTMSSRCMFSEIIKVPFLIITTKNCKVCNTDSTINLVKTQFPVLDISYLYYPSARAQELIKDFGIRSLPAYFLGRQSEKEKNFENIKDDLARKGDLYMLKPRLSGETYLLNRKRIKNKLDIFISLSNNHTQKLLKVIRNFNPSVHFLAIEQNDNFDAYLGNIEVEEYLRSVCVQKLYPQMFWDYIECRSKSMDSSWWEDCAGDMEINKIKVCARGMEGRTLLRENISLNKELGILMGPTYLLGNQEIFASQGAPSNEELKKILKDK